MTTNLPIPTGQSRARRFLLAAVSVGAGAVLGACGTQTDADHSTPSRAPATQSAAAAQPAAMQPAAAASEERTPLALRLPSADAAEHWATGVHSIGLPISADGAEHWVVANQPQPEQDACTSAFISADAAEHCRSGD
jgi:hypothetical protein